MMIGLDYILVAVVFFFIGIWLGANLVSSGIKSLKLIGEVKK